MPNNGSVSDYVSYSTLRDSCLCYGFNGLIYSCLVRKIMTVFESSWMGRLFYIRAEWVVSGTRLGGWCNTTEERWEDQGAQGPLCREREKWNRDPCNILYGKFNLFIDFIDSSTCLIALSSMVCECWLVYNIGPHFYYFEKNIWNNFK